MDGPDEQFRFFFGVVRGESNPDPIAAPVYADPVGERFRVIVPIGGKDAVSVAEFPAYVSGLPPFQGKGDGGGLRAFGLVQRQAGDTREPLPDYLGEGVFVPFDALEAGDEAFAARRTGAEPGDEVHGGHDGRDGLMALRPGFELAGGRGGCRMQAVGAERLKHVFPDCRDADMSPEKLVDGAEQHIRTDGVHIDGLVRGYVHGVHGEQRAHLAAAPGDAGDVVDGPDGVGGVAHGDDEGIEAGEGFFPAFSVADRDGVVRADGKDFVAGPQVDAERGHAAQQEHPGAPFHILGELRQHLNHGDGAALRREVFGGFAADMRMFLPASAPLRMSCAVTAPAAEVQKRGTTGRLPVATITASGDSSRTLSGVASHEKRNATPARWALRYR